VGELQWRIFTEKSIMKKHARPTTLPKGKLKTKPTSARALIRADTAITIVNRFVVRNYPLGLLAGPTHATSD